MPKKISGGCLCGAIRYEGTTDPIVQGHCQCRSCQQATGTGHISIMAVPKDAITVTGELTFYEKPADSGNVVRRGFCPTCGSSVLNTNDGMADMLFLMAGCLDDPSQLEPQFVVFHERGQDWDHLDPSLPTFPGMPPQPPGQG
jgi:hypothetical protein